MRKDSYWIARAISLIAVLLISSTALAQDHILIACQECRDPNVHPSDYGNTAFNLARAPNNGLSFEDIGQIEVRNLTGQWAWVTLEFEMLVLDFGFKIPTFLIPTGNIVVVVTDSTGRRTEYLVDLDIPNQLTVGTGTGPGYNPAGGSNDSGNGGSGGDYGDESGDYWDGWENGYGGPTGPQCWGDFSDPYNTTVICIVP